MPDASCACHAGPDQVVRLAAGGRAARSRARAGRGARLPRAERRRQDDADPDGDDDPARRPPAPSRSPGSPTAAPRDPSPGRCAARERRLPGRADRRGVPPLSRPAVRTVAAGSTRNRRPAARRRSGSTIARRSSSRRTAAGCGSGSASHAPSSTSRRSFSSTSRRSASIPPASARCSVSCGRIARDRGATVVLSTHLLAEVEEICDRVLIIHRGRVVVYGTVAEVAARAAAPRAAAGARAGRVRATRRRKPSWKPASCGRSSSRSSVDVSATRSSR